MGTECPTRSPTHKTFLPTSPAPQASPWWLPGSSVPTGDMPTGSNMKAPLGWGVQVFILKSFRLARTSPWQLCCQEYSHCRDPPQAALSPSLAPARRLRPVPIQGVVALLQFIRGYQGHGQEGDNEDLLHKGQKGVSHGSHGLRVGHMERHSSTPPM